jgi:hypothetical protein
MNRKLFNAKIERIVSSYLQSKIEINNVATLLSPMINEIGLIISHISVYVEEI